MTKITPAKNVLIHYYWFNRQVGLLILKARIWGTSGHEGRKKSSKPFTKEI